MADAGPSTSSGGGGGKRPPRDGDGGGKKQKPDPAPPFVDWGAKHEANMKEIRRLQHLKFLTEDSLRQKERTVEKQKQDKRALTAALAENREKKEAEKAKKKKEEEGEKK